MTMAIHKSFSSAKSVLGIVMTKAVIFPIGMIVGILVARILGPSDRGVYAFLTLVGGFCMPFLTLGFGAGVTYFISKGEYSVSDIGMSCILIGFLQGALNALIIGILWQLNILGKIATGISPVLMYWVLSTLPFQGVYVILTRIILGVSWFKAYNIFMLIAPLLSAALLVGFVVVSGWGLKGAVISLALTQFILCFLMFFLLLQRFPLSPSVNFEFIRKGFGYGIKAWLSDIAVQANARLDHFILGIIGDPVSLGIYTIAVRLCELLWIIPDSLAHVLFNRISACKDQESRIHLIGQTHRFLFLLLLIPVIVFACGGSGLIRLIYGAEYSDAALPLWILLPGTITMICTKVITKYFGGSGKPGRSSLIQIIGLIFSVLFYFTLIPALGMIGAAAASSLVYIATALFALKLYAEDIAPVHSRLFAFSRKDLMWGIRQIKGALYVR